MLNDQYTYIAFDFETTGLDTKKDEPIQLGIVQFDHTFQIIDTFQSLIQPKKTIKELKEIVRFVTGFQLEDLETAPSMEDILPEIQKYFLTNTVVIGHNIWFDLAMLNKYMDFTPAHRMDTYPLAKTIFHFQPSYALDILDKQLEKQGKGWKQNKNNKPTNTPPLNNHRHPERNEWMQWTNAAEGSPDSTNPKNIKPTDSLPLGGDAEGKGGYSKQQAHDALYDSFVSMNLFQQCIERITHLRHSYLLLDYVLQESNASLKAIIRRTEKPYKFEQKQLFFPVLKKHGKTSKRVIIPHALTLPPSPKPRYVGKIPFATLLKNIDRSEKKYILAFTHRSKYLLAQQHLQQISYQLWYYTRSGNFRFGAR